jgi:hypothetical protein
MLKNLTKVKAMAESRLLAIRKLHDFRDEVISNLESQTSWGKNQAKEMVNLVFDSQLRRLTNAEIKSHVEGEVKVFLPRGTIFQDEAGNCQDETD